jgi:hypothetical protein
MGGHDAALYVVPDGRLDPARLEGERAERPAFRLVELTISNAA